MRGWQNSRILRAQALPCPCCPSRPEINSDSIDAELMTLVLKGNASYFQGNTGIQGVSLART
eukprot:2047701-Rhodomonas_salina.1